MRLQNKVVLITGAANGIEGELMSIGGASAALFAKEGAKVAIGDLKAEAGERTAQYLRSQGAEAIFIQMDVTSEDDWIRAIQTTVDTFGKLDVLVNNAGTSARFTVEETDEATWDGQMNVHAKGVFLGTKHAIPEMRKLGGGSIVNTSSIYGIVGSPTVTAYHAAKGAVRIFTKSAAIQLAKDNIRVNSIHPGYAVTPLTDEYFAQPEQQEWLLSRIPMGRIGRAEDMAPAILFLASDESSYVTGSEIVVDGGVTAQ